MSGPAMQRLASWELAIPAYASPIDPKYSTPGYEGTVIVEVDPVALFRLYGKRALTAKGRKARTAKGAIVIRAINVKVTP